MKICVVSLPAINAGKHNLKDSRLDQVHKITGSKKETYIQVEVVGEEDILNAEGVLSSVDAKQDLILKDLEFVETRLGRAESEAEKALLNKLKTLLEKEELIFQGQFSEEEKRLLCGYGMITVKPVALAEPGEAEDPSAILMKAFLGSGYISFFTTGEKETRAWAIKKGATAWEAAGAIHSDIQRGFIRAEIIPLADFIACGGESKAKQAGKLRLEQKGYLMQDGDLANFRFNK